MARSLVVLTEAARGDLDAIFDYLFVEASPEFANLVTARLVEAMRVAAAHPYRFRERPDYHPRRPRRVGVQHYAVLFEILANEEGIRVLRVLHERQDIPHYLG